MADIIAMFSRWAKSGLSAMFSRVSSSSITMDESASSSAEPTRRTALDDFQRITRMLPRIESVLGDAEEREIHDRSVNLWLSELRLLAYEIDDVVDEYEYEVLRAAGHRVKHKRGDDDHHDEDERGEGRNILASSSSSSQVPAISYGMAEKIRVIRERFDEIEKDRYALRLREEDGARRSVAAYRPRPTSSLVDESSIIGRESDKEKIMELLLLDSESSNNIRVSNKITVIPIVGMGGVGKTTLAQIIYNDPKIYHDFDHRIWIHVSNDFDVMRITKEIYSSITKNSCKEDVGFDHLQDSIKKMLLQKRMFLVLDDVWNEEQGLWESLQAPLHGANTVKILITTRNKKVADVMRTMDSFNLGFLSEEEGWRLFQQHALCDDEHLMEIGKGIVKKCGGLPLAIKLLGSHLRFEADEDKWLSILDSELWDLDLGTNEILPALRLSYQRMPIHLKPCFRYLSMFLKNEMFEKNRLVWLWMAQGYIQPKIADKTLEETGKEYFDELLGRSFLQVAKFHENSFVMHDLIFDLAVFISGKEFTVMKLEVGKENECISDNVRHLVIHGQLANNEALEGNLMLPSTLRSMFYYSNDIIDDFQLPLCLRALHIWTGDSRMLKFLGSITSLKHLRYLYISQYYSFLNGDFSSFFNLFHSICNVQVLDFSGYHNAIMLPACINNLINLRHLILPYDSFMPCGISKLTSLQTLKDVIVEDGSHECGGLGEIEDLTSLTGSCCISNINYATDFEGVKKANISRKKHIWILCLDWSCQMNDPSFDVSISFAKNDRVDKQRSDMAEAMLQVLQPHNSLKELEIYDYPGIRFPLWLGDPSYSKLRDIKLKGCTKWEGTCRVLDRGLPCLRSIFIINCVRLKNIEITESSSLRRLLVQNCPGLTSLHGLRNLYQLESLEMIQCYNLLISMEERLPSKLQSVCFKECWKLRSLSGLQNLHSLKKLMLIKCQKLQLSLDEQLSTMPGVVEIIDCPGLREWCQIYRFQFIQELSNIKELTIPNSDEITSIFGTGNLVSLETLHIYDSVESDFPKDEWIPCSLHTLHLNSCPDLKLFPPYQNLSALRLLKIWHCEGLTYLSGLQMMKSLEKLEIIDCPQFTLSPVQRLPSKLKFLLISNCPSLLWLPGLQQLFSLIYLTLDGCPLLMLPPPEQLPFMLHVQLEIFNCPKLRDWCRRYNLSCNNNKESTKVLFARSSQQIKLWLEEGSVFLENICVLDYDEALLETEKWPVFRVLGFYICSSVLLSCIKFGHNFLRLKQLRIWNCFHLEELDGVCDLISLQDMDISKCPNLKYLSDFPKSLQSLAIDRCNKMFGLGCQVGAGLSSLEISSCSTLEFIECQDSLRFLKISNCPELCLDDEWLPDTLHPNNVEISACPQLQEWCQKQNIAYSQD